MRILFSLLLLVLVDNCYCQNICKDHILGYWITTEKDLIVYCYKQNNKYYAKVAWFKKYDDAKHDKPKAIPESEWLNSIVMMDFKFSDNEWKDGKILDLNTGKKYDAYIKLQDKNTLKLVGYILLPIFSESLLFEKYTESKLPSFK